MESDPESITQHALLFICAKPSLAFFSAVKHRGSSLLSIPPYFVHNALANPTLKESLWRLC